MIFKCEIIPKIYNYYNIKKIKIDASKIIIHVETYSLIYSVAHFAAMEIKMEYATNWF